MNAKTITKKDGITASVLRSEIDSTNGGITKHQSRITLIGEFDDLPEDSLFPIFRVKTRGDYIYAEPVASPPEDHIGWMNGGNFVYSGNGWFNEQVNSYPIAIHDRSEFNSDYYMMSR